MTRHKVPFRGILEARLFKSFASATTFFFAAEELLQFTGLAFWPRFEGTWGSDKTEFVDEKGVQPFVEVRAQFGGGGYF